MNFMVPGNASTKYNKENQTAIAPVGEYNKRNEPGVGNDPTQFLKPVNTDAIAQLTKAGLLGDPIRGTTSSSARREVPSMVFGMSTPGPLDRRPGKPKVKVGAENAQTEIPASRLTGSTFVMDDGDPSLYRKGPAATTLSEYATLDQGGDPTLPMNELVRIRTRTGHQILFHNTEDLVYIAHGSGQSWIEMTAGGAIEVYSKNNISFKSDNDINFTAAKNINFKAGADVNIIAVNQMSTQTGANWDVLVGADGRLSCAGTSNIVSTGHYETAGVIHMNGPAAGVAGGAAGPTTVPSGSGSAESGTPVAVKDGATVPLGDTYEKCAPGTVEVAASGLTSAERAAISNTTVTSTPSRNASGASSEGTAGEAAARAGAVTVPPYDDAILRQARAGAATLTSASRTGPPTEYDLLP